MHWLKIWVHSDRTVLESNWATSVCLSLKTGEVSAGVAVLAVCVWLYTGNIHVHSSQAMVCCLQVNSKCRGEGLKPFLMYSVFDRVRVRVSGLAVVWETCHS